MGVRRGTLVATPPHIVADRFTVTFGLESGGSRQAEVVATDVSAALSKAIAQVHDAAQDLRKVSTVNITRAANPIR